MMTSLQTYVRRGRLDLLRLLRRTWFRRLARGVGWFAGALVLSAAAVENFPLPLSLGLLCAGSGWPAVLVATGGALGYRIFWGSAGFLPMLWMGAGTLAALLLGDRGPRRLMDAMASLIVAACGVGARLWLKDETPLEIYLLQTLLAAAVTEVSFRVLANEDPVARWLAWGFAALALAQLNAVPALNPGLLLAGGLAAAGAFPAAAMAGLAVDLAQSGPVPISAVVCLAFFARFLPKTGKYPRAAAAGVIYLMFTRVFGGELLPVVPLCLGGFLGVTVPGLPDAHPKRGELGIAQVRLEMAAGVMANAEQLLLEAAEPVIDAEALMQRLGERSCGNCPCRKPCPVRESIGKLDPGLLKKPGVTESDLPAACRKRSRLLLELRRQQEQYRLLTADHRRQKEYREAVVQQYQFLADYLRDLSDLLGRRCRERSPLYEARVAIRANRPEGENGDRCFWFAGTECRFYLILCDGMGTGPGAVEDGNAAGRMLRRLLSGGFPADHALRSLNSLCALRGRAGAVSIDLAEISLDTGRGTLYKWGSPASYLVTETGAEQMGTATPPPGLSVPEGRETVERLSLRRGETLILRSDGAGGEVPACLTGSPEALAEAFLPGAGGCDDATVAALRLTSLTSVT